MALARRLNPPKKSFPFGVVLMLFSVLPWLLKIRLHPAGSLEWFELGSALAVFLFISGMLLIGVHLARLPRYRSEAQKWGSLYYCYRCDDAFEVSS